MARCEAKLGKGKCENSWGGVYPKCKAGYVATTATRCEKTAMEWCEAKLGKGECEESWGGVYPKCRPGYAATAATHCEFSKGVYTATKVGGVHTCAPDYERVANTCYTKATAAKVRAVAKKYFGGNEVAATAAWAVGGVARTATAAVTGGASERLIAQASKANK